MSGWVDGGGEPVLGRVTVRGEVPAIHAITHAHNLLRSVHCEGAHFYHAIPVLSPTATSSRHGKQTLSSHKMFFMFTFFSPRNFSKLKSSTI